jgi:hypothetical protein
MPQLELNTYSLMDVLRHGIYANNTRRNRRCLLFFRFDPALIAVINDEANRMTETSEKIGHAWPLGKYDQWEMIGYGIYSILFIRYLSLHIVMLNRHQGKRYIMASNMQ